jgi:hypothetical protein
MVLALAACGAHDSVAIEIVPNNSSVTSVELFVVNADCGGCEGIAPPSATSRPLGPVHLLDSETRYTMPVTGGSAIFLVKPEGNYTSVPELAAVGYDANGKAIGFALDKKGFEVAGHLGTRHEYVLTDSLPKAHVTVWHTPEKRDLMLKVADEAGCLAIAYDDNTNEFLVNPVDQDCDGYTTNECDANWYQREEASPSTDPNNYCFTEANGICQVGQPSACTDGTPPTCGVLPKTICVPNATCGLCSAPYDQTCDDKVAIVQHAPRLHCTIPINPGASAMICPGTSSPFALDGPHLTCNPGFAYIGTFPVSPTNTLEVATPMGEVDGALRIDQDATCELTITQMLELHSMPQNPTYISDQLFVFTAAGDTVLMPVTLEFTSAAANALPCDDARTHPTCDFDDTSFSDSMWKCTGP